MSRSFSRPTFQPPWSRFLVVRLLSTALTNLLLTALPTTVLAQTFPDTPDAWTEFETPAQAAAAGWSALPAGNPSLSVPKVDAWAGNAVQANGWQGVNGGGLKFERSFGLPPAGSGSTLRFFLRAEANGEGSSGVSAVTLRARFPNGSVYRNLVMFTAGPGALTLYVVDMDIAAATTTSDPWTTWRKDAGSGTLTNSSWGQLQSLEWTAERCRLPADFIQVDRLSFEIQSGTARLSVRALNIPSRKYLIARLQPQGLGTGMISCTLEVLDQSNAVVLRREAPMQANQPRDVRIEYAGLPKGTYVCRASAYRAGGLLAQGQAAFNNLEDPPWMTVRTGVDPDRVVKPWTPVTTGERQIGVWGRTMTWDSSIFPDSITSSGEQLLASPTTLAAGIGAETHTFRLKNFRILSHTPARAVAEAVGDICDVEAIARITADFDGFLWFEIRISNPKRNVTFSWLRAQVPLRASQMRLYQTFRPGADGAGAIGSSPIQLGWLVNEWVANFYHWFGNEDRGIGFTFSTLEKWKPATLSNFCTFVPGSPASVYQINLIESTTPADGLRFEFGIQATPIKPLPP
ncbi:MAG: glycoside hydrolase domain-containing protein, partial [Armatimonadota bacterium]